ncbi:MAG TPA: hypothetical protein VJM33_03395 [Microthrixaceae bacterium]|nr:hypothetical protein [Microthrixaceae bacterium]
MGEGTETAETIITREGDVVGVGRLVSTRRSLHQLAEHVLAADLHRHTGRIGLRASAGGLATPTYDHEGRPRRVRIEGTTLVVDDGGEQRSAPISTLRAAARLLDIEPGGPAGVYPLSTPLEPDAPLDVDPVAARMIAEWFSIVDRALERFAAAHGDDSPTERRLWPEHFDLALSMGEANYGGSPGDDGHDLPYLYVGPWSPREGEFWNEPFGASRSWKANLDRDDAVGFLDEGHDRLTRPSPDR